MHQAAKEPTQNGKFGTNAGIQVNLKDEIPPFDANVELTVQILKDLLGQSRDLELPHSLITDETLFLSENYSEKSAEILKRLDRMMKKMWNEVPPCHLRVEQCNVIAFVVTITEMFSFINETMKLEKSNVPCDVIDKLLDYMPTVEQIKCYGHVELIHFAHILALRDDVTDTLQSFYRIKQPMESKQKYKYPRTDCDRYNSYDAEWLCGSIFSGPHYLTCTKYTCVASINQQTIYNLRYEYIAARLGIDAEFLTTVRVPMPFDPKDPRILAEGLANREFVHKEINTKMHAILRESEFSDHPNLHFTRIYCEMTLLQADIRKRKRMAADTMLRGDKTTCKACCIVIGTMASIEAQLLMVHKVYSLFVDREHGMFGKGFPKTVSRAACRAFMNTTIDNCRTVPLAPCIVESLADLRTESRKVIKEFYKDIEELCEQQYTTKIRLDIDRHRKSFSYELHQNDFPEEVYGRATMLMQYLLFEENEMNRMNAQINYTRHSLREWPPENNPRFAPFTLNVCTGGIISFRNNFEDVMLRSTIKMIRRNMLHTSQRYLFDYCFGGTILAAVHTAIDESDCVPSRSEIHQEFISQMKHTTEDKIIEDTSAAEFATMLAEIVHQEIAVCDLRSIHKNQLGTAATAKKMVSMIVLNFLEYIKAHTKFLSLRANADEYSDFISPGMFLHNELNSSNPSSTSSSTLNLTASDMETHMANMALLFQSLSLASEEDNGAIYNGCLHSCSCDRVPDLVINAFFDEFSHVDLGPLGNAPLYNMPLD